MKKVNLISFLFCLLALGLSAQVKKDVVAGNIDNTVDPRQDFFSFANGGWLKANPIPASESRWGIGNVLQEEIYARVLRISEDAGMKVSPKGSNAQKIGDFWFTGMDSVGIEKQGLKPLSKELKRIANIKDMGEFFNVVAYYQTIQVGPMFNGGVGQDSKNSEVYSYYLGQGGLGLPNRDYYINTDERNTKIREAYIKHLAAMFELMGDKTKVAEQEAKAVMAIETDLAKASRKLEDMRDPYKNYNKMSMAQLQKLTPSLPWAKLIEQMGVSKLDSVVVGQPEFLEQLEKSVRGVALADWKSYLRWQLVTSFADKLSNKFSDEHFNFYGKTLSGRKEQKKRWKRVLDAQEGALGDALGQLFVTEFFPAKSKARYELMVDNIMAVYRDNIKDLSWMSAETKAKALLKLDKVNKKVGYPTQFKDFSKMNISRSSFCENWIEAQKWWYYYNTNKMGKPVDRNEWDMTPQTYNAYYNPSNNEIVLPAAQMLVPGFSDDLLDDAVAYGYTGASTIGHEITHGFDDEGRQFDAKGNLNEWWTPQDAEEFKKRAQVMIDQFNGFVVLDSMHVKGEASLGENIADFGGIVLGLKAFMKTEQYKKGESIAGYTPVQRFFLGYALGWMSHQRKEQLAKQIMTDVHAPAMFRVNGPFANVPEFYEAFGVKEGDKMYRAEGIRVKIW
jgi:putative endopeptidase